VICLKFVICYLGFLGGWIKVKGQNHCGKDPKSTSKDICMGIDMGTDTGTMDISKDHNRDSKAPHIFPPWAIDESPLPQ
jgi:hypothetical protein